MPTAWAASVWKKTPLYFLQMAPISFMGWIVPISLLTIMTCGWESAASRRARRGGTHGDEAGVGPDAVLEELEVHQTIDSDGEVGDFESLILEDSARVEDTLVLRLRRDAAFFVSSNTPDRRREGRAHMCFFFPFQKRAVPLMLMLFDSVAPEVKTMSLALAPMRSATYCQPHHQHALPYTPSLKPTFLPSSTACPKRNASAQIPHRLLPSPKRTFSVSHPYACVLE